MKHTNEQKTILHIIQNFGRGGAETAVWGVLKNLKDYRNIVVTLDPLNEFGEPPECEAYYCLNLKSYYYFPLAIPKLRRIIRRHKVDLVHSQLYWSTVIARFATPARIPLVTSIQASLTNSVEYKKKWIADLDRFSYKHRPSHILGVSRHTLEDYFQFLKLKRGPSDILYNYVDARVFNQPNPRKLYDGQRPFRVVSVGNLKPQKNHPYLLEIWKCLKGKNAELHIYGDGQMEAELQQIINEHQLKVVLKGKISNLPERLPEYDLFMMASRYEGFSLAVLEGMAMRIPMFLSSIPTFVEQCSDSAMYFELSHAGVPALQIESMMRKPEKLEKMAEEGYKRVMEAFTLEHHLAKLRSIYASILTPAEGR
jgi:glycosyltransferase involved in cell wall biosynthesis